MSAEPTPYRTAVYVSACAAWAIPVAYLFPVGLPLVAVGAGLAFLTAHAVGVTS